MKPPLILAFLLGLMAPLLASAQQKDRLGASDAELERLKQVNSSAQAVSLADAQLRKLMVGKWSTGRHEYAFKADGTWRMLPADTRMNGTWHIADHKLVDDTGARIILEASPEQIVLRNDQGIYPFRYRKIE